MSTTLRKIIDMGLGGSIHPGSAGDYRFHDNRRYFAETGTRWVRLWADWPSIQPDPAYAPDEPAGPGYPILESLDAQIAAANSDGVRVVLQVHRFPLWANGLAELNAQRNTDVEISFAYADRISPRAWDRYVAGGRDPAEYNPSRRGLELRIPPEGVGPESAWARFFDVLYARYGLRTGEGRPGVDAFELVNEPNFQWWPQRAPSPSADPFEAGELTVQHAVAQLMQTAQTVSARYGHAALVFAPSLADSEIVGRRRVTWYDEFAAKLLDALDGAGYRAHAGAVWSHHNYNDVEQRTTETRTQRLRALLDGRWCGYAEGAAPTVFMTEGGVRLSRMRSYYPAEEPLQAQARTMREAWDRHDRDDGAGAGVGMLAQYTMYGDPSFDTGLLPPWPSMEPRPIYDVWASLPGRC